MEGSPLEKSNSDLIAEDLAATLKQVVLEIKEIRAVMVLKKDFDPFIGYLEGRTDFLESKLVQVQDNVDFQRKILTGMSKDIADFQVESSKKRTAMEQKITAITSAVDSERIFREEKMHSMIEEQNRNDIKNEVKLDIDNLEERMAKAFENSQIMMANYVEERLQGFDSFVRENPMVTIGRGSDGNRKRDPMNKVEPEVHNIASGPISREDHQEKREKAIRRQSIFGVRDDFLPYQNDRKSESYWPNTVTTIQLVTRSSFPDIELRSLSSIEHICYFLDQYQNTVNQHQNHQLRMIQFCNKAIYPDITVAAKRLKFISTNIFTGGLMMLTDKQLQECIYEHVKAKSPEDFIQKIKRVRFRVQGKEESFHPDASNIPELLNAATYFTHIFRRTSELITETCDPDFIPPMYKEGKTMGLIDYYLAAWPNDSGNILYSRLSVITPALRVAKSLQEFSDLFLEKIEPYTRLKQQYDDVNAMLRRRVDKQERGNDGFKGASTSKDRFKGFDKSKSRQIFKREQVNAMAEEADIDEFFEGIETTIVQTSQHDLDDDDDEEQEIIF